MASNFDWFVDNIGSTFEKLPDSRLPSPALKYEVKDAALGAFSLFFSQSPLIFVLPKFHEKSQRKKQCRKLV
mgnify:CR=1 FL=1|jgi:hypothetical protein